MIVFIMLNWEIIGKYVRNNIVIVYRKIIFVYKSVFRGFEDIWKFFDKVFLKVFGNFLEIFLMWNINILRNLRFKFGIFFLLRFLGNKFFFK